MFAARRLAQVTGARQRWVVESQVVEPVQAPETQGQPMTSLLQVWQRVVPSQYWSPSHFGSVERQGQLDAPAVQVSATQVPEEQVKPVPQVSPVPHGQPSSPAGQVWQVELVQRRPVLHVPFARQVQAASPRRQSVQVPLRHSPVVHEPPEHSQPINPAQPASIMSPPSLLAGGGGQADNSATIPPARVRRCNGARMFMTPQMM